MEGPLAALATVMSGVFLVPQLRRLRTTFDGGGVSPAAAAVGLVSTLAWAAYGLGNTNLALVAPSLVGAVQYAVLLAFLRSSGTRTASGAVAALAWCLGLGAATAASVAAGHQPLSGLGAALTVAVVVQYTPAVYAAYRSESVSGIAAPTWLLVGGNGLIWAAYGALVTDAAVAAYGTVLVTAAGAVLAAIRRGVPSAEAAGAVS